MILLQVPFLTNLGSFLLLNYDTQNHTHTNSFEVFHLPKGNTTRVDINTYVLTVLKYGTNLFELLNKETNLTKSKLKFS